MKSLSDLPAFSQTQATCLLNTLLQGKRPENRRAAAELLIRTETNASWRKFAAMATTPVGDRFGNITVLQQDVETALTLLDRFGEVSRDLSLDSEPTMFVINALIEVGRYGMKVSSNTSDHSGLIDNYDARCAALSMLKRMYESIGLEKTSEMEQARLAGDLPECVCEAQDVLATANEIFLNKDVLAAHAIRSQIDQVYAAICDGSVNEPGLGYIMNELLLMDTRLAVQAEQNS